MYEVLFDDFGVMGAQCQVQAVLALYASGRTTGMVLDAGDGVTHTVPVFKGYGVRTAVCPVKNAGRNISFQVLEALNKYHGLDWRDEPNGLEIGKRLKEEVCRVAYDYEAELEEVKLPKNKVTYTFKDMHQEELGEVQIVPAEVLFRPKNAGYQVKSMSEMIQHTLHACNVDMRSDMYKNTVLSGGTTCIKGFAERIEKEYKDVVPSEGRNDVKIHVPDDRKYAVFSGGSILCCLTSFQSSWITREEWE